MLACAAMRLTDEELLAKLKKEQEKLQSELAARKAKLNARTQRVRSRLSARERKTDTRRKILVGAMMLKLSDQHTQHQGVHGQASGGISRSPPRPGPVRSAPKPDSSQKTAPDGPS